jgi:hypothetical protein
VLDGGTELLNILPDLGIAAGVLLDFALQVGDPLFQGRHGSSCDDPITPCGV